MRIASVLRHQTCLGNPQGFPDSLISSLENIIVIEDKCYISRILWSVYRNAKEGMFWEIVNVRNCLWSWFMSR